MVGRHPCGPRSRSIAIPAVGPGGMRHRSATGCRTAKVKVAERGQTLAEDVAARKPYATRSARMEKSGIDGNAGWSVDEALHAVRELNRFRSGYVEQPCASVEELAELRRRLARSGLSVPIAADESIRRAQDPIRWRSAKQQTSPFSGAAARWSTCLLADCRAHWLPVVVSSALETSIGIRAGLALAAALPELSYACGLNTVALLADDLAVEPLIAVDGVIKVGDLPLTRGRWTSTGPTTRCSSSGRLVVQTRAGRWVTPPRARG